MIFYETAAQPRGLLLLVYAGAGMGLLYDLLSPFRRGRGKILPFAVDFFFCLLSGALCFLALALGGESRLRLYACAGLSCGAVIYALGIRRIIGGGLDLVKKRLIRKEKRESAANDTTKEKGA